MLLLTLFLVQAAAQTYCSCGPTTTMDTNLGTTYLVGDSSSIADNTNCPGSLGPMDLTALVADLSTKTYVLNTTVTTCSSIGIFSTLVGAWIDWNQDFLFTQDEQLGAFSPNKNTVLWSFQVPKGALPGKTRLRVQVQETQATVIVPCASFPYGGTKDFSINVNISPADAYCVSGPLTVEDSNLGGVTLIGENRNIRESTDCPGKTGVQVFLDLVADVSRGRNYSLTYNVTTCGERYNTTSAAWIDWEHDGVFTAPDLLGVSNNAGPVTLSFTVPSGSYVGNTVLRVQVQETTASKIDPCATFSYGGTKDFTITLLPSFEFNGVRKE